MIDYDLIFSIDSTVNSKSFKNLTIETQFITSKSFPLEMALLKLSLSSLTMKQSSMSVWS